MFPGFLKLGVTIYLKRIIGRYGGFLWEDLRKMWVSYSKKLLNRATNKRGNILGILPYKYLHSVLSLSIEFEMQNKTLCSYDKDNPNFIVTR